MALIEIDGLPNLKIMDLSMAKLNNQMVNGKMPIADWLTTEQLKLSMWQELVQSSTKQFGGKGFTTGR